MRRERDPGEGGRSGLAPPSLYRSQRSSRRAGPWSWRWSDASNWNRCLLCEPDTRRHPPRTPPTCATHPRVASRLSGCRLVRRLGGTRVWTREPWAFYELRRPGVGCGYTVGAVELLPHIHAWGLGSLSECHPRRRVARPAFSRPFANLHSIHAAHLQPIHYFGMARARSHARWGSHHTAGCNSICVHFARDGGQPRAHVPSVERSLCG